MDQTQNTSAPEQATSTPPPAPNPTPASSSTGEMKQNTLMAVLAYIGPLVIISYLTSRDDAFVKFHIQQGLVVFAIEVIIWVLGSMVYMLWPFLQLLNLCTLILSIIGIVRVVKGEQKELPFIGKYGASFKI